MKLSVLQKQSYVPYSQEASIAVVKSEEGHYFPGTRIENISYPLTIDAAQNALFCCLSEGFVPARIYKDTAPSTLSYWAEEYNIEIDGLNSLDDISFHPILTNPEKQQLGSHLNRLLGQALDIYSDFPVAALIESEQGFVSGVNIENRDWSRGLCAERVALAKALSYGITDIQALHITTSHGEYNSPCGACRQVIIEHLPHHPVFLYHADGTKAMHYSSDLIPYSFQSTRPQQKNPH